jgi:hypothetical protein
LVNVAHEDRLNDTEIPRINSTGAAASRLQERTMTQMKLYYSPLSPYARKVRMVAMETRLDRNMEMVNVSVSPVVPNADVVKHIPSARSRRSRSRVWTSSTRR